MSYLVPAWEMSEKDTHIYANYTADAVAKRALDLGIVTIKDALTLRKLEPHDLGLANWQRNSDDWWIKWTNFPYRVIGIYKLVALSPEPKAEIIRIYRGYTQMCLFTASLSEMYSGLNVVNALRYGFLTDKLKEFLGSKELRPEAYLSEPVIYDPQDFIQIRTTPANQDTIVIVGFVAEPKGMTVA